MRQREAINRLAVLAWCVWQFWDGEGVGVAGGHPLLGPDGGGGGRMDDQGAGLGQQDGEHEGGGQEEQDRA